MFNFIQNGRVLQRLIPKFVNMYPIEFVHNSNLLCNNKKYRAAILEGFKKPLNIETINNPTSLGDKMVRIGVYFCSLNLIDVKYMTEEMPNIFLPTIPGIEFSGEILETGPITSEVKVGDRVVCLVGHNHAGGGLAEQCIVHEMDCFPINSVSLKDAAVLIHGHGTAMLAFTKYCPLSENDVVIVIAGAAGNGLAAIEVAHAVFHAKVLAISDSEISSSLIRDEGAYKTISIKEGVPKVCKFLENALQGKKAKCVYDAVGNGLIHSVSKFVDPDEGYFLSVDPFFAIENKSESKDVSQKKAKANDAEKENNNDKDDRFIDRIQHIDLYKLRFEDLDLYRQTINDTLSLVEEEIISPHISKTFDFHEINEAVEFILHKKDTGKILIDIRKRKVSTSVENEEIKKHG